MIIKFERYINEANDYDISTYRIITNITNIIKKYNLEYFLIGNDIDDYYINSFNKRDDGIYLDYEIYSNDKSRASYNEFEKIENLPSDLLYKIWEDIQKNHRIDPEDLLENIGYNILGFKTILKKTKEKINFNTLIFEMFYERGIEDELMKKDLQDVLFKTHPEAVLSFLESDTKILPSIIKKYNLTDAVEDFYAKKNAEKYNL